MPIDRPKTGGRSFVGVGLASIGPLGGHNRALVRSEEEALFTVVLRAAIRPIYCTGCWPFFSSVSADDGIMCAIGDVMLITPGFH